LLPSSGRDSRHTPIKRLLTISLTTLLLWSSAILVSFPFIWTVRSSIMTSKQVLKFPPIWIPTDVTLSNYANVLSSQPFGRYIVNSLFVASSVTFFQVLIAAMGAYAFARLRFPGRDRLFLLYLSTMIIPSQVTLIPQYVLMSNLGWIDSYPALIVPFIFSAFLSIPRDLEDAARIDGAGYVRIFLTVILPLSEPVLATSSLLAFMSSWTSFLWP
jgi:multiple sugar transport system permease protein